MRKPLIVLLAAGLVLVGCGGWSDSRTNPRNWFGNSRSAASEIPQDASAANPLIPRQSAITKRPDAEDLSVAIAAITELRVKRTTTGAIIHVIGIASRQGAHKTELRIDPVTEDTPSDILSFTFRVIYPKDPTPVGSEHTRTIHEAYSLSNQDLRGIRLIRVRGEQNVMETQRR